MTNIFFEKHKSSAEI